MSISDIFGYVRKVDEITSEIKQLTEAMTSKIDYRNAEYEHFRTLREKLNVVQVYLNEAMDGLQWRHELRIRLKNEFGLLPWIMAGVILGTLCLYYFS